VGDRVGRAAGAVLGVALLSTVPLCLWRELWTNLLFGAGFAPAAGTVGLVALAMIPVGLTFVLGTVVAAAGRQTRANGFIVVATIINLLLNAWLIPRWAAEGAATTTVITELCICAGNFWVARDLIWRAAPNERAA
jgi:O-antigen/teichoic acid export membrane protein